VLQGACREAVKPHHFAISAALGHRYGFVRAALRNRAPLVPLASIGTDEVFDFTVTLTSAVSAGCVPPSPSHCPVRILPIPHFVKVHFTVGEPYRCDQGPERRQDMRIVRRLPPRGRERPARADRRRARARTRGSTSGR